MPRTMSCVGVASGAPCAGDRMLFEETMRIRASACASALSGRWTAIWSPSKSALNAWQTSGWTWIALPSTRIGSNAWMPRRCSVGARVRSTGGSAMTSPSTSPTPGVVDALAEQVLAEPALLALEHVGERLQRAVARPGHGAAAAAVVEQRVDGLLEHPLLVVDDDLRGAEVEQPLQAVVAVDDAPVVVVEVGGREAPAVQL